MENIVMLDPGTGQTLTEGQRDERLARAAARLRRRGVRVGDTVLVCLPVGPDLLVAADAVMAAGATVSPLAPDDHGMREQIITSSARLMIADDPRAVATAGDSWIRVVMSTAELGA
ncbi:AMP-binding protein [Nonomuraea sp. NBC_01738]|uniref:AMP-binding protein n=1 Tax=Nonomuraea sp. NBC_01738 TaxID=2976003 RepID=UPI002E104E20|nr:AMP-binding protein [Nonomuraea sp. NBC_01738]